MYFKKCFQLMTVWFAVISSTQAEQSPVVVLTTDYGNIEILLHIDKAPLSAGDFLYYVNKKMYENEGFYRIVRADNDQGKPQIDVIQGGLLDDKLGLPPVAHENTNITGLSHTRGTVSLARDTVGSGSAAYFFIVINDAPSLDFGGKRNADGQGFAAFGSVVGGMDVVEAIHKILPENFAGEGYTKGQVLNHPVRILKAGIRVK